MFQHFCTTGVRVSGDIYFLKEEKNQALYFLWKTRCEEDRSNQDPISPGLNSKCLLFWYVSLAEKLAQVPVWLSEPLLGIAQIKCPTTSDKFWNAGVFLETSMKKKLLQKDELYQMAQSKLPGQNGE